MSATTLTTEEFETAWNQEEEGRRYDYVLNKGLFILYGVLLTAFWTYFLLTVGRNGLDLVLGIFGAISGCVTGWVVVTVLYWRHFGRKSGAICGEERLIWRNGDSVFAAEWREIDFEALGLTDVDLSHPKYEHYLTVEGARLWLFRPHVRMRELQTFMGAVLLALQQAGRIDQTAATRATKSRKNRKKKGRKAR